MEENQEQQQEEEVVASEQTEAQQQKTEAELVEKAQLDHALKDLHKVKAERNALSKQMEDLKMQGLKEKEDWKKVAELREQEATKYQSEMNELKESYIHDKKLTAVREVALKSGIRPEAIKFLEDSSLDGVIIETTSTGKLNIIGADQYVDKFKAENRFLFQDKSGPNIDNSTPQANIGGEVTIDQIMEAYKKGNTSEYHGLYEKYLQQTKRS